MAAKKPEPPPTDLEEEVWARAMRLTPPPPPGEMSEIGHITFPYLPVDRQDCERQVDKACGCEGVESAKPIHVIPCGAKVHVGLDIPATVLQVLIEGNAVQYKLAWWDGRNRHDEWVHASEVTSEEPAVQRVGFGV